MSEAFTSLLRALAPALGLPEITQQEDSSCLLVIDDFEVSLRHLPGSDAVMMFTVVAPLPEKGRETLYAALLDANTFFHETQGFTLAARQDKVIFGGRLGMYTYADMDDTVAAALEMARRELA